MKYFVLSIVLIDNNKKNQPLHNKDYIFKGQHFIIIYLIKTVLFNLQKTNIV